MAVQRVKELSKRLECPVDEDGGYTNDYWTNRDLIPTPHDRRTFSWVGYAGYWIIAGINTATWTIGASLFALGLSLGQAIGMIVAGSIIIGLVTALVGIPGSRRHVGFTVLCRSSWGMRGAFWPVLNRVFTGCVFMGIQMYWGGQSTRIILNAIIGPKFIFMKNTLPASANVTTPDLICFFIFIALLAPILLVPPEKLQTSFRVASAMIISVLVGTLIWSLAAADGLGSLEVPEKVTGSALSLNMLQGLTSLLGGFAGGVLGQSDWTRYSRHPNAALFGQGVAAPLSIMVAGIFGILISAASSKLYGQVFWNPFELLLFVQTTLTPASRAGTFFAGLGLFASQASLCIVLTSVSAGMDLTTLAPKYINIKRGATIVMIIGIAIVPWNFVNQPSTFITVLSGWSVFLSSMTGVIVADYFLVRKGMLCLDELYIGNSSSRYWYTAGFNWRAVLAWAMGLWPLLPGFVRSIKMQADHNPWDGIYAINYFFGFIVSIVVYYGANLLFPVKVHDAGDQPEIWRDGVFAYSHDGGMPSQVSAQSDEAESEAEKGGHTVDNVSPL